MVPLLVTACVPPWPMMPKVPVILPVLAMLPLDWTSIPTEPFTLPALVTVKAWVRLP